MCFFHVKFNCKKNYKDCGLTTEDWKILDSDIDYLHECLGETEFKLKKDEIIEKWTKLGWINWLEYFSKQ